MYKVCHKDDESSIWAIKKIKLGESGSVPGVENEKGTDVWPFCITFLYC